MDLGFFGLAFTSLFSIVDPLAAVPIFLALVGADPRHEQKRAARRATLTVVTVLGVFAATGTLVFRFFGITIPAFKAAGGVILFLMSLEMMRAEHARTTSAEASEAKDKQDIGIVPVGVPLLSGPGAIASAVMWSARAHTLAEKVALGAAIASVGALTLLVLSSATRVLRVLGQTGINVMTRIMGLVLAATAAQFVLDGVREALSAQGG